MKNIETQHALPKDFLNTPCPGVPVPKDPKPVEPTESDEIKKFKADLKDFKNLKLDVQANIPKDIRRA